MKKIGIVANPQAPDVGRAIDHFIGLAEAAGIKVNLAEGLETVCSGTVCPASDLFERSDVVVALGGDGTILRAAALGKSTGVPILGVNMGRLGFLAGATPDELVEGLERLKSGGYEVEDRMALEAKMGGSSAFALNEVVIEKGVTAKMVQVKTSVEEAHVSSFLGNGVIVSTPTGSTSYSLSAGGPVLHPDLEAMVLTPICPHSLTLRPLVIPADQSIEVEVIAEHTDIMLTTDGHTVGPLKGRERVVVRSLPEPVRLINLQGLSFYSLLRRKLDWSLDRRLPEE
ncbi:MAG: NAD(+)/NADH kinase [Candidatus Latescibacteria bacterium]|nr:NAD(+)/NADH kinase [Candidatus Latescibacterota bacterium]